METILTVNRLNKKYKHQFALKNVSLEIRKGEIYGLIGRNGAGKTTLLKSITRLIAPSNGTIALFGSSTDKEWTNGLKRTGAVIETPSAYDQLTAKQNLTYYCKLRGIVNAKQVVEETLELVDLKDTGKKKYKNFSLGMKQKLGIGIAILTRPDFLILDEPINGLDPIAIVEFRRLVKRLNEERGMTIIISSHILTELYYVATRFGIINDGQLVKEISKEEFDQINDEYIVLQTKQIQQASQLLQDSLHYVLKVVDNDTMHIFGESNQVNHIIQALVEERIVIDGIYHAKQNLEDYFTELVGGNEEDIHHG
ncbi:ABC transporter ATP-binding protein [Enterococcus sp. 669A]|uniref:ABC transporter ATP-binding protein n=1 Tax=Candidatus Enterococcus moelleringii TaxID=2815325 RepID=A0ABS3L6P1_9ENTE|nr:ABC transporter ATP-binding protein [Enterococcus sp. 669A]MBO1305290.1 ABC transporter ATP-binding protein [Enterococcus sp. 669A]